MADAVEVQERGSPAAPRTVSLWVALATGLLLGVLGTYVAMQDTRIQVYEGTVTIVDEAGTAIGFQAPGANPGYTVAGAMWREHEGPWHGGDDTPTCLIPGAAEQALRLAVVEFPPAAGAPGETGKVVWFECLDPPARTG
jgi:hypothetical protein